MQVGDRFILRIMDEILIYEVDQIRTVLPEELKELQIVEGEDYCTLVTCTPYGVNSHRLSCLPQSRICKCKQRILQL